MSVVAKQLVPPVQLSAAAASYYQVPVNTTTQIQQATLTNTSGNARTVTVYLVAAGGNPGDPNTISKSVPVPQAPGRAVILSELIGQILPAGASIVALADAAAAVTLTVSGIELS